MSEQTPTPITQASIQAGLEKLGLKKGDRIVMHSSLRSLGKARDLVKLPNCGLDYAFNGILDVIGPQGILCVPTFTDTFMNPKAGPVKYAYDPDTTPSRVGDLTNAVLAHPKRVRSLHPTHSWAAIGADAAELVKGHDKSTTFGRDSLCGRLYDWDFKILWFGTQGNTNTATHFAEDWLDMPYMTSEDAIVKEGDGWRKVTVFRSPSGPRDFYKLADSKVDKKLETVNFRTIGQIHNATVTVMRCRDFVNFMLRTMIQEPLLLMHDGREDDYHKLFYKLNTEYMENFRKKHGTEIPAFLNPQQ